MSKEIRGLVDCKFIVQVANGRKFTYEPIDIKGPLHNGALRTATPPLVGDFIGLTDRNKKHSGVFKVLARQWMHSSYGSYNWPMTEVESNMPPVLEIVVQKAVGHITDDEG